MLLEEKKQALRFFGKVSVLNFTNSVVIELKKCTKNSAGLTYKKNWCKLPLQDDVKLWLRQGQKVYTPSCSCRGREVLLRRPRCAEYSTALQLATVLLGRCVSDYTFIYSIIFYVIKAIPPLHPTK